LLLKQTLEEEDSSTSLLPKGRLVDLGDYGEFIHRHDASKQFSFKVTFVLEVEEDESVWVKEILKDALVGLTVVFAYDEKTKMAGFFLLKYLLATSHCLRFLILGSGGSKRLGACGTNRGSS
jgi:hypothetical protein